MGENKALWCSLFSAKEIVCDVVKNVVKTPKLSLIPSNAHQMSHQLGVRYFSSDLITQIPPLPPRIGTFEQFLDFRFKHPPPPPPHIHTRIETSNGELQHCTDFVVYRKVLALVNLDTRRWSNEVRTKIKATCRHQLS